MNAKILAGEIATMLALGALPLRAQTTVEGDVRVESGPVTAHVEIGPPPPTVVYAEPAREVIVVEEAHVPHGHAYGWWKNHGYREVTIYYDGNRYYARRVARPRLREVVVYERAGHYYQEHEFLEKHGHGHNKHDDDD